MASTLAERFESLRLAYLDELKAEPGLFSPEAVGPLLAEFREFLAEAGLAPADLCTEVVEFHLYACARNGENTLSLERRGLALKGFFAWAAHKGLAPDLALDIEPLTREGRALSLLIYHRWPPAQSPALVRLETDLPDT